MPLKPLLLSALGLDRLSESMMNPNKDETNQPSLNPNATPFTPKTSNNTSKAAPITQHKQDTNFPFPINVQNNRQSKPESAVLASIEEEKESIDIDDDEWICDNLYPLNDIILKLRYIIFISGDITRCAVRKNAIKEYFNTEQDLFYHLRWQCRMQVIDKKYKIFKSTINNQELVIFHSDLHSSNNNGNALYIIGTQNDVGKTHSVKWKMTQFMTANDIYFYYGINAAVLPQPSRINLYKMIELEKIKYMKDLKNYEINIGKLMKLEQIKKKPSNQPLTVTFDEFNKAVTYSIAAYELMPIVWFDKREQNASYKIRLLLPVQLRGNWIGIVFDYNRDRTQLIGVSVCVDHVDIQRKLALFKPLDDGKEYKWFENDITEIKATNDALERRMWLKDERIKELERIVGEQDQMIKERDELIERLRLKDNQD